MLNKRQYSLFAGVSKLMRSPPMNGSTDGSDDALPRRLIFLLLRARGVIVCTGFGASPQGVQSSAAK